jgi:hypothetical protein
MRQLAAARMIDKVDATTRLGEKNRTSPKRQRQLLKTAQMHKWRRDEIATMNAFDNAQLE